MKLDATTLKTLIKKGAITQQDLRDNIFVAKENNQYNHLQHPNTEERIESTKKIDDTTRTILLQAYDTLPENNTLTLLTQLEILAEEEQ